MLDYYRELLLQVNKCESNEEKANYLIQALNELIDDFVMNVEIRAVIDKTMEFLEEVSK